VRARSKQAFVGPSLSGYYLRAKHETHRLLATFLVASALLPLLGVLSLATPAAAALLPPLNPSVNIAPSSTNWLTAIDSARAAEGVGPLPLNVAAFDTLSVPEQLFVVVDLERTGRGEAPVGALTAQLDGYAQTGADQQGDPGHPATLAGGASVNQAGAIWAGGTPTALYADYLWMYEDGWGGTFATTTNADCTSPSGPGCWAHRAVILRQYNPAYCNQAPVLSMGAGSATAQGASLAALIVATCGAPSDPVYTWTDAQAVLTTGAPAPTTTTSSPAPAPAPSATVAGGIDEKSLIAALNPSAIVDIAADASGHGYWLVSADGAVYGYGDAPVYGSMLSATLSAPIVGLAATPDGLGYWLVASDGGIFAFGDAGYYGSTGGLALNAPIVGLAATPDGRGYWLVASDGGIFSFGDASFEGSMGGTPLNAPVVDMTADPVTGGYWLVASDGGIFAFDAPFAGSTGGLPLVAPIVGIQAPQDGQGYRMDATDGGVFSFSLPFLGSMGGSPLTSPVLGMASDAATGGYWLVDANGGVFSYGAPFMGSDAA
jgi:hypothetical protein